MRSSQPPFPYKTLTALLEYNKLTGLLSWRIDRSRLAKAGTKAGTLAHNGTVVVGIQGRIYAASKLIWYHVTGVWTTSRLRFKDGDPTNLRWNNIYEEDANLSLRKVNVYQRRYRRIMKLARDRLKTDAILQREYVTAPTPAAAHGILRRVALHIESEMLRNDIDPASRPPPRSRTSRVRVFQRSED